MPNSLPRLASVPPSDALRRVCFGGTFNPIHHGHLLCARAVAEVRGFDRVTLIPSAVPPHKSSLTGNIDLASAQDRLAMCRLAVEGDPLFETNDIELHRSSPSFTIDTARELKRRGWPSVSWLIGGDVVPTLPSWHESFALLAEVQFIVMERPGSTLDWNLKVTGCRTTFDRDQLLANPRPYKRRSIRALSDARFCGEPHCQSRAIPIGLHAWSLARHIAIADTSVFYRPCFPDKTSQKIESHEKNANRAGFVTRVAPYSCPTSTTSHMQQAWPWPLHIGF
jgi:nicotinate (nicotinamide) nucleotide adenylyltransferase